MNDDGSSTTTVKEADGTTTTYTTPAPSSGSDSVKQPRPGDDSTRPRELTEAEKLAEKFRPGILLLPMTEVTGHTRRNPDDEVVNPSPESSSGKSSYYKDNRFSGYTKEQWIGQPLPGDSDLPEEPTGEGDPTREQATNPSRES